MYKFNTYWTDELKANFLERVIAIHSYLYYERDNSIWTDKHFDEISKQLVSVLKYHDEKWIIQHTQYGYAFYDFDGTTGFLIWDRLTEKDKEMISTLASMVVGVK